MDKIWAYHNERSNDNGLKIYKFMMINNQNFPPLSRIIKNNKLPSSIPTLYMVCSFLLFRWEPEYTRDISSSLKPNFCATWVINCETLSLGSMVMRCTWVPLGDLTVISISPISANEARYYILLLIRMK